MNLVFYTLQSEDQGKRVRGLIREFRPDDKTRVIRTLVGLAASLRSLPSPDVALLLVADQAELSSVLSLKKFLQNTPVILVLPDRSEAGLRLSSALSPLLVCFQDGGFMEVLSLLDRLSKERPGQRGEGVAGRCRWTRTLPWIPGRSAEGDGDRPRHADEMPVFP